jgi:uncharacterized membrane protein
MKTIKNEWFNWIIILIPIAFFLIIANRLPEIESYKLSFLSPYKVYNQFLLMLIGTVVFYAIVLVKASQSKQKGTSILKTLIVSFGMITSVLFLSTGIGLKVNTLRAIWIISAIFIIIYGNFYPVIKFKSFLGINNRWTNNNPVVWKMTHEFSGKMWFVIGIIAALYSTIFDISNTALILSLVIFALVMLPRLYSFYISKKMEKQNNPS